MGTTRSRCKTASSAVYNSHMDTRVPLTPYILMALALVGLGITGYLAYFQYLNLVPSCAIGGCEVVLTHWSSKPFGVPFSYIGLLYYAHMLGLAIVLATDPRGRGVRWAVLAYAGIGLGLSLCFELWQFFVIGAMCIYCAMSAATNLLLTTTAAWHYRTNRNDDQTS